MGTNFPNEVLENIFKHMDARSFMLNKKVCIRWKEIISKMEQMGNVWLDFCLLEIPKWILIDISKLYHDLVETSKGDIFYHMLSKMGWIFWKEIFKEYVRASHVKQDLYVMTNVKYNPDFGQVTALAFNDLVLYSGFENGGVCLWKNLDTCQKSTKVIDLVYSPVQAIYCNPKGSMTSQLQGVSKKTETLMVVYKDKVKLCRNEDKKSKDNAALWQWQQEISRKPCENPHEFCSIPGGHLSSFEWYSGGYIHHAEETTKRISVCDDLLDGNITAAAASKGKIVFGKNSGEVFFITSSSSVTMLDNLGSSVRWLIIKGRTILCLTDDSNIHVSANFATFRKLDAHKAFGCHVECIAWHASILVIGTKYGVIHVYHVPTEESLLKLDLSKSTVIHLNSEHVNAIAIGDDGSRPVVAVATDTVGIMHVIRW
ncbi:uncharacterized protein LOC133192569 [Saccostrea echinata]|uniref:uncharacterized protein LOC133192569 n=1 Tax=Saccostrea echinata TaxID=191078 RepID=UPI002A8100BC|nr:uncharacterized protein LOC133192569 [Saccostrea echinata]